MVRIRICSHAEGAQHNCEYVDAINRLIPSCERTAWAACRATGEPTSGGFFARAFSAAMDVAARERGLR